MLTQPQQPAGCGNPEIEVRCVSSGKLNVGGVGQGDTWQPVVTVFSSSSKKTRNMVGSVAVHWKTPPEIGRIKASRPAAKRAAEPEEARHTLKFEVTLGGESKYRAAYFRPSGSRWSPKPQSQAFCGAGIGLTQPTVSASVTYRR